MKTLNLLISVGKICSHENTLKLVVYLPHRDNIKILLHVTIIHRMNTYLLAIMSVVSIQRVP